MAAPFELVRVDDGRFVTSGIHRGKRSDLGGGLAPHFNFNVVVQFVGRVSVAVEAHVTPAHAFGIDQLALIRFDVIKILARAKSEIAVKVIIENCRHA